MFGLAQQERVNVIGIQSMHYNQKQTPCPFFLSATNQRGWSVPLIIVNSGTDNGTGAPLGIYRLFPCAPNRQSDSRHYIVTLFNQHQESYVLSGSVHTELVCIRVVSLLGMQAHGAPHRYGSICPAPRYSQQPPRQPSRTQMPIPF